MKRILVIGNSPLPDENTKSRPAAGLRTYQFLSPLLKKGGTIIKDAGNAFSADVRPSYNVALVTIAMPECYNEEPGEKEIRHPDGYTHLRLSKNDPALVSKIQRMHDEFNPDAILAVNTYPSYIASLLESRAPLWADLNGWIMAEAQAQAYRIQSNDYMSHYYDIEKTILKRADKFSTVSEAQRFALLGELSAFGRINSESFGYRFVYSIPNGTEWFEGEKGEESGEGNLNSDIFKDVPDDAFVLMWIGGYNTWVDEITLFKSVENAMEKCEKLYFVSTGGGIEGLDNKTFKRFKEMIENSKYRNRFVFLGWVSTSDMPKIYKRANCGINVDRRCVETLTGARNRINEMMKFSLPVVTTLGSEISFECVRAKAGLGVKGGKIEPLSEAIISMYKSKDLKEFGENGRKYIEENCNYEVLSKPLKKWLENPRPAPDRGVFLKFGGLGISSRFRGGIRYIKENGISKFLSKLKQKIVGR
jgi:glycosyltransferase involved in cell wall biosynthesis